MLWERVRAQGDPVMGGRAHRHIRDRPPCVRCGERAVRDLSYTRPPNEEPSASGALPGEVLGPGGPTVDRSVMGDKVRPTTSAPIASADEARGPRLANEEDHLVRRG